MSAAKGFRSDAEPEFLILKVLTVESGSKGFCNPDEHADSSMDMTTVAPVNLRDLLIHLTPLHISSVK